MNIQVDLLSHCSDALCMRGIRIVMKRDHFGVRPYTVSSFLSPIKQVLKFFLKYSNQSLLNEWKVMFPDLAFYKKSRSTLPSCVLDKMKLHGYSEWMSMVVSV